jgi:ParB family chromosome partitioning protein
MHDLIRLSAPAPATTRQTIQMVALDAITTDTLTHDRAISNDYDLEELITSIRDIGLSHPIQIAPRADGRYDLVQGSRRLAAYRALHAEDSHRWANIPATYLPRGEGRDRLYRCMVDENIIRKELSFAEMAIAAQTYAADPETPINDAASAVAVLFHSAGYQRRSYIRKFVQLMDLIGPDLSYPHYISRSLGLTLLHAFQQDASLIHRLRADLAACDIRSPMQEIRALYCLISHITPVKPRTARRATANRKTFHIGPARCIAGQGSLTLKVDRDFTTLDRAILTEAIKDLLAALD